MKKAKRVLFVGNLVEVKGVDRLLSAWQILVHELKPSFGIELLIIGEGPKRQKLEKQAKDAGIAGSVRFAGGKPHREICHWMRSAYCLCLPSRSEGMPNVVLEALACGIPVVASRVGEVPFLIEDGVNGFIVPKDNECSEEAFPACLAEALARTLTRTWDVADVTDVATASAGPGVGVKAFTWEHAAQVLIEAICQTKALRGRARETAQREQRRR
ncbi:MAG: glycosyltransferase [bacterium]